MFKRFQSKIHIYGRNTLTSVSLWMKNQILLHLELIYGLPLYREIHLLFSLASFLMNFRSILNLKQHSFELTVFTSVLMSTTFYLTDSSKLASDLAKISSSSFNLVCLLI